MRTALLALLSLVFTLGACGGRTFVAAGDGGESPDPSATSSSSSSSADDAGSSSSSQTTGLFPVCPKLQPKPGSPCPTQNQGCAYLNTVSGECESWTCNAENEWVSSTPAGC